MFNAVADQFDCILYILVKLFYGVYNKHVSLS